MNMLLLALPLLALAGGSSSLADRQLKHPWGRWQVGAWVQTESTSPSFEGGTLVEREQLTGRSDSTYELTGALLSESGDVESTFEHSWALGGHAYALDSGRLIGNETITVEGRERECEVWEARWQNNGQPVVGAPGSRTHSTSPCAPSRAVLASSSMSRWPARATTCWSRA